MGKKIIFYEIIGFTFIILSNWLNEIIDIPHLLFNAPQTPFNITESILESFIGLLLAVLTILFTKKLLERIKYLEGFLRICCVCKKIYDRSKKKWLPFEAYFNKNTEIEFSHGYCPDCLKKYSNI